MSRDGQDWTPEEAERLRALAAEGHSYGRIATMMGRSKSAIVGKAHRLSLPPRETFIGKTGPRLGWGIAAPETGAGRVYQRVPQKSAAAVRLARARSAAPVAERDRRAALPAPETPLPQSGGHSSSPDARVAPSVPAAASGHPVPAPGTHRTCQWPSGDPRAPGFRFCGDPNVVPGRPYCAAHCCRAYVVPADRRQDAA